MEYYPTDEMAKSSREGISLLNGYVGHMEMVRAKKIADKKPLTTYDLMRMYNFFNAHSQIIVNADNSVRRRWSLYGGDAGFFWTKKTVSKIKRAIRGDENDDSLMFSINVPSHKEIMRCQNKLRKVLPREARFNNPETFHMTLVYIPEPKNIDAIRLFNRAQCPNAPWITSSRIGFFDTQEEYAIVLLIDKNEKIAELQKKIYDHVLGVGETIGNYSNPDVFTPHITLAYTKYGTLPNLEDIRVDFAVQAIGFELEKWGEILETYSLLF